MVDMLLISHHCSDPFINCMLMTSHMLPAHLIDLQMSVLLALMHFMPMPECITFATQRASMAQMRMTA